MAVNADKPHLWKTDVALSVDFYNEWFVQFAPQAYRETRARAAREVEAVLKQTANLTRIGPDVLKENPSILPVLRMTTAPPIARDRLAGLAGVASNLVNRLETEHRLPPRFNEAAIDVQLQKVAAVIMKLIDRDLFTWLEDGQPPSEMLLYRAATIIADRVCGAQADPIIRNAQEQRQLATLKRWLEKRGYALVEVGHRAGFDKMKPGTFAFRLNVPVKLEGGVRTVLVPVDVAVMPLKSRPGDLPLLIEAKSAGDYTNTNKRRKEEAIKAAQLRNTYGQSARYILFLCGYFDSGYLGYEAAEGIDWVWEHRVDDLAEFGV